MMFHYSLVQKMIETTWKVADEVGINDPDPIIKPMDDGTFRVCIGEISAHPAQMDLMFNMGGRLLRVENVWFSSYGGDIGRESVWLSSELYK